MLNKLLAASLYIFFSLFSCLHAQEILQGSLHNVKEFAVADVSCESSRTCNSFLKVISHSSGFPIDKARYSIHYTFLYHATDNNLAVTVTLDSIRGTTEYRGFDLSDNLLPSSIELAWAYQDREGARIPGGHKEVFRDGSNTYYLHAILPENYTVASVVPVDIQFIYREADFEDFDAASRMIQRYYAASDICDTLLKHIGDIDTRDFANLVSGYLLYYDFRRVESRLIKEAFYDHLPLTRLDPADHTGDMNRVAGRLYGLKMNLDISLKAWRGLVKQKSAEHLAQDLFNQSRYWFDLSDEVEYHYKELVYSLGKTDDGFCVADSLARIFQKGNSSFYPQLCKNSVQRFLESAYYNLYSQNYTHAIALGQNAEFYATKADTLDGEVKKLLSDAWEGLYNSYLLISRRTIAIGNYEFTEQYLNEASRIFTQSKGALESNAGVDALYNNLFESMFDQGMTSLQHDIPRDAMFFLGEAARIDSMYLEAQHAALVNTELDKLQHAVYYSYLDEIAYFIGSENGFMARDYYDRAMQYKDANGIFGDISMLDSLDTRIKTLEYYDFISSAKENRNDKPDVAMTWLEQAAFYVMHENIETGPEWHEAIETMIVPDIEKRVSHGRVLIWGGKIQEALQLADDINGIIIRFGLHNNPVNDLIIDLYDKIDEKRCFDLENNYRKKIFSVRNSIRENRFLEASEILDDLQIDAAQHCGVDVSVAKEIELEYNLYFDYYRYIDTCGNHLIYSKAEEAVESYLLAQGKAEEIHENGYSFDEVKLTALMEMYRREFLTADVAKYLAVIEPSMAVSVLQSAASGELDVDRKILHKVGLMMGEEDIQEGKIKDGSFYSEGRKNLSALKRAYNAKVKSEANIWYKALVKIYYEAK